MEYCSAIKRDTLLIQATSWMDRSMRAPPHTCSFSTRRLTSQGQWRVTSKFFGHQGLPQASGTSVTGRYSGRIEEDKNDCDQDALQGNLHEAVNLGACFHFKEGETEGERRAVACPKALSWQKMTMTEIKSIKTETQRYDRRRREILRHTGSKQHRTSKQGRSIEGAPGQEMYFLVSG